jgi:hypothetical protein
VTIKHARTTWGRRAIGNEKIGAAYRSDLREFKQWCRTNNIDPRTLPAIGIPNYKKQIATGIAQDIRRGLSPKNDKMLGHMISALFWWRVNCVDPSWGFFAAGKPHVMLKPIGPTLIEWIDAAIEASLKSPSMADLAISRHDLDNLLRHPAPAKQEK